MKVFNRIHRLSKRDRTMLNVFLGVVLFGLLFWMATQLDSNKSEIADGGEFRVQSECPQGKTYTNGPDCSSSCEFNGGSCKPLFGDPSGNQFVCDNCSGGGICTGKGGDADSDNVCADSDCNDNDNTVGQSGTPGGICDDGNPLTGNDRYDNTGCNCTGRVDQVVVCSDSCNASGVDKPNNSTRNSQSAQACSVCSWTCLSGTFPLCDPCEGQGGDSDNDGVCNNNDCKPNDSDFPKTVGSSCNDGDTTTIDDEIQSDGCTCAGIKDNVCSDGETLKKVPGTMCDDGDVTTYNDRIQDNGCVCSGLSKVSCGSSCTLSDSCLEGICEGLGLSKKCVCDSTPIDPCSGKGGDSDGDGVCNDDDNCPDDPNPAQNNVCQESPSCGLAAGSYSASDTGYRSPFCSVGDRSPSLIGWLGLGESTSWECKSGSDSVTCTASREAACTDDPCNPTVDSTICRDKTLQSHVYECVTNNGCNEWQLKESCGLLNGKEMCSDGVCIEEDVCTSDNACDTVGRLGCVSGSGTGQGRRVCELGGDGCKKRVTATSCEGEEKCYTSDGNNYGVCKVPEVECTPDNACDTVGRLGCVSGSGTGKERRICNEENGCKKRVAATSCEGEEKCYTSDGNNYGVCKVPEDVKYYGCNGSVCVENDSCTGESVSANCYKSKGTCEETCNPPEDVKYYGCNGSVCIENDSCTGESVSANCYSTKASCDLTCNQEEDPVYYGCGSDGCVENTTCTGESVSANCYSTKASCDLTCNQEEDPVYYGCNGSICVENNNCTGESVNANCYVSKGTCEETCSPAPTQKYGCNNNGQCVESTCTAGTSNCFSTSTCDNLCTVAYQCPAISKNHGDVCDDEDETTTNDRIQTDCTCKGTVPASWYHFTCTDTGWTGPVSVSVSQCLTGESCNIVTGVDGVCCTQSPGTPSATFCPDRSNDIDCDASDECGKPHESCYGTCSQAGAICDYVNSTDESPKYACIVRTPRPSPCEGVSITDTIKTTPTCGELGSATVKAEHAGGHSYSGQATKTYGHLAVGTHPLTISVPVSLGGVFVQTCTVSTTVTISCNQQQFTCPNSSIAHSSACSGYGGSFSSQPGVTLVDTCPGGTNHCAVVCVSGRTKQGNSCVLDDNDTNNTGCENKTCDRKIRECDFGNNTYCTPSCSAGMCGDCTPAACSVAPCTDTTRDPDPGLTCQGQTVTQVSNCGNTKTVAGTKICSSSCTDVTWTPDPATRCSSDSFTQRSNCGTTRVVDGTKNCTDPCETDRIPDPNTVCSGLVFTQTSNCETTRVSTGTKVCSQECEILSWKPARNTVCTADEFTQISNCGTARVRTGTKICSSYSREKGDFGDCSVTCGGGIKEREFVCKNTESDDIVSDTHCDGDKPASEVTSCNTEECPACVEGETKACGSDEGQCAVGYEECIDGMWSGQCKDQIVPDNEVCDGKDNDCDGSVDEGVKNACDECGMVPIEICDSVDNDCDGQVDESGVCDVCQNGEIVVCGSSEGECRQGMRTCREGQRSVCEGETRGSGEVCDNKDNDCDGESDEGLSCNRGGGGGGSGGGNNYCGDGNVSKNRGEECDDGNYENGDGCSKNCRKEGEEKCGDGLIQFSRGEECDDGNLHSGDGCDSACRSEGGVVTNPKKKATFEESMAAAVKKLRMACYYDDVDYKNISFRDVEWKNQGEPADILRTYCIVKGYDKTERTLYHGDQATSVAEAIKIVSKIDALYKSEFFDEYSRYDGYINYTDVKDDKRYAPYVGYSQEAGLLYNVPKKIGKLEVLKPLTPISKQQTHQLLDNAGIMESYRHMMGIGQHVKRENFAEIVVDAFSEVFADYTYMYGNNIELYQSLYVQIRGKSETEQKNLIKKFITKLDTLDRDMMGSKFNIHVDGMIEFLGQILRGQYDTTYGSKGEGIKSKEYMNRDYSALREYLLLDE